MLKKFVLGVLIFVIVAVTGAGIYITTLDWNKKKPVVEQKLAQITGLKATISGNLKVKLMPKPSLLATNVKFFNPSSPKDNLVAVDEISASFDLFAALQQNFIIKSMSLKKPVILLNINEQGNFNWSNLRKGSGLKSSRIEASLKDVRLTNAIINYKNLKDDSEFQISEITANLSANSLDGPYKMSGKFIRNGSEVMFNSDASLGATSKVAINIKNASSGMSMQVDGEFGENNTGNVIIDSKNLSSSLNKMISNDFANDIYNKPFYCSFKYNINNLTKIINLDNFVTKYGEHTAGSGSITINNSADNKNINANFDMAQIDLLFLSDIKKKLVSIEKVEDVFNYDLNLNINADAAWLNGEASKNFSFAVAIANNLIDVTRFSLVMPGETSFKSVGKINLDKKLEYSFNQMISTKDLDSFASFFGINLKKNVSSKYHDSIFGEASAELKISGNTNSAKINIIKSRIDATDVTGNIGFIGGEETYVIADMNLSTVIIDEYIDFTSKEKVKLSLPVENKDSILTDVNKNIVESTLSEKFIDKMKRIPWNKDIILDAHLVFGKAVLDNIPMEQIELKVKTKKEGMNIDELKIENFAGAKLDINGSIDSIFSSPVFNDFKYKIATNNLDTFLRLVEINTNNQPLNNSKVMVAQGVINGSLEEIKINSIQKIDDIEFTYSGLIDNTKNNVFFNGDLELKAKSFHKFLEVLNVEYRPDIPFSIFTYNGKVKGGYKNFELLDFSSYIGTNNISGTIKYIQPHETSSIVANLKFDKFEVNKLLNTKAKNNFNLLNEINDFIAQPELDETTIDLSMLASVNLDITSNISILNYNNINYSDVKSKFKLQEGVLSVEDFSAKLDKGTIDFNFILDSNDLTSIKGKFAIKNILISDIGGNKYRFTGGNLILNGSFDSVLLSEKEFVNNLNVRGDYELLNTKFIGWDLSLIKFDIEQYKSSAGFEDAILSNLRNGETSFDYIGGDYNINSGILVSDNSMLESSVVDMSMNLTLNLNDFIFSAIFNTIFKNATFSEIIGFDFYNHLANPEIKLNVEQVLDRISLVEENNKKEQEADRLEQDNLIKNKSKLLLEKLDGFLLQINKITFDIIKYKPNSDSQEIIKAYDKNVALLNSLESKANILIGKTNIASQESDLVKLENELHVLEDNISFIQESLLDNFMIDCQIIFDKNFNKTTWLYNLAQLNALSGNDFIELYSNEISNLVASNAISEIDYDTIKAANQSIVDIMEKINTQNTLSRDIYLMMLDASSYENIQKNNAEIIVVLNNMLNETNLLISTILEIADNYKNLLKLDNIDDFIIYPPENIEDIDVTVDINSINKEVKDNNIIEGDINLVDEGQINTKKKKIMD